MPTSDPQSLLARLTAGRDDRLLHVEEVPSRVGTAVGWPDWVDDDLRDAWTRTGIALPWAHQAEAADLAHSGRHVVVSTGTASGKSLAYLMPALTAVLEGSHAPNGRGATALYLAPTKALAHDQWRSVADLGLDRLRVSAYDGDTVDEERAWIRAHAGYVLSNPDLLHRSMLPGHERWSSFLRALRYVVVDECHVYRGVFGSHVANVLRRLQRVAARYGSEPVFVLASATSGDPAGSAARLVGSRRRGGDARLVAARIHVVRAVGAATDRAWRRERRPHPAYGDGRDGRRCSPISWPRECAPWRSSGRDEAPRQSR